MAPVIALLAPLVKDLVANGLNLLAGGVMAKGKEWVEEKTGLNLDEIQSANDAKRLEFRQAEMKHEELLLQAQLEGRKLDIQEVAAYLGDVKSARERESAVVAVPTAPYLNKVITPVLAIGILTGSFGGLWYLINIVDADWNPAQKDIIFIVLGALTAMATQVISYYFGSSRGDAANSQALQDVAKKAVNGSKG
jgi:hypothetical protein